MDAALDFVWLAFWAVMTLTALLLALKWLPALLSAPTLVRSLKGPINLPIVGYLPFITRMPHRKFHLLAAKYGPIFKINLANMNTVVLNDFHSISLAFKREEFLGRPKDIAFNVLLDLQGLATLSGAEWKELKRFTMQQMKNLGLGKFEIEQHIKDNIGRVMDRIETAQDKCVFGDQLFDVDNFGITNLLFGDRIDNTDASYGQLQEAIANAIQSLGQISLFTFFPQVARFLARLKLVPFINRLKANFVLVYTYIQSEIEKRQETLDEHSVRDYIDSFLVESKRRGERSSSENTFTKEMLAGNTQEFLAAGIETTRTTLHWALLILATFQDVQQRLFLEVDRVCGNKATPSWFNRAEMVYAQAVICEMQRWKTISPLNLIRMTTADNTLDGFHIAKGTHVIANLWAVHFDPTYWHNPQQFDPERFIGLDKQLIKHQQFIPFSIGKRSCPGESLAQMEVFLYVTCLLQKYKIELAEENSLEEVFGLTLHPKQTIHLRFISRAHFGC